MRIALFWYTLEGLGCSNKSRIKKGISSSGFLRTSELIIPISEFCFYFNELKKIIKIFMLIKVHVFQQASEPIVPMII